MSVQQPHKARCLQKKGGRMDLCLVLSFEVKWYDLGLALGLHLQVRLTLTVPYR